MKNRGVLILACIVLFCSNPFSGQSQEKAAILPMVSGTLIDGYRVLTIPLTSSSPLVLVVFRGDYVKFSIQEYDTDQALSIPALALDNQPVSRDSSISGYVKMNTRGKFEFTLGNVTGTIEVIDYREPSYSELSAMESAELIDTFKPLVLDVRSPMEYASGHLENAVLIPVQQLQKRLGELSAHQYDTVLIYCATGNRSTVASKILIDNGFKKVVNMRYGIKDWLNKKQRVVK